MSKQKTQSILTINDMSDMFSTFANDSERLKYMRDHYRKMPIVDAFNKFYGCNIENSATKEVNKVTIIELGNCYWGTVESIDKSGIRFSIPGVKDEIVSKENFSECMDEVQSYLLSHSNQLRFEVRAKRNGVYYVSVINAYYKLWYEMMEKAMKQLEPITVHIDSLTKGGYLCHTEITPLNQLTGKNYTSSVFIPGSNIVLNIERDFGRWIGEDVTIVPQKFVKFRQVGDAIETSLIGSRKAYLQQLGIKNLYDIYMQEQNVLKLSSELNVTYDKPVFEGTVTGIINSNNKTGIFVELNDKFITGLMPIDASELLDYKPGDQINVIVKEFEVQEGKTPFVLNKKNQVIFANTRCVFERVR